MKKTYINPTTEIINVETAQMIALSLSDTPFDGNTGIESRDEFDIWSLIEGERL